MSGKRCLRAITIHEVQYCVHPSFKSLLYEHLIADSVVKCDKLYITPFTVANSWDGYHMKMMVKVEVTLWFF